MPTLEELLLADLPDLIALGKAVLDAISQKSAASAVQAAVAAVETAADVAEQAKTGKP